MIRMRVIGYCFGIRSERRLSDFFDPIRLEPAAQPLQDISLELRLPTGAHVGPAVGFRDLSKISLFMIYTIVC